MFLLLYSILTFDPFHPYSPCFNVTKLNPLENATLFGGDMIIHPHEKIVLKNGLLHEKYRWPGYPGKGIVPYTIDKDLNYLRGNIMAAMKQFHDNTCIRFVQRTNERDYVRLLSGWGCYAVLGRNSTRRQPHPVSLGLGCEDIGTIVHQLCHVIGLVHEHNRPDRDKYLVMYYENVIPELWYKLKRYRKEELMLVNKFDYDSIMIFGNKAFTCNGLDTMKAKNGQRLTDPSAKWGLDKSDIERINALYKCKTK